MYLQKDLPIERYSLSREEAIKFMKENDEPYKVELIEELPEGEEISFYKQGEFVDLCAGPHLMSTGKVKVVKLLSASGAYWRGNENNKMLQRVYGISFPINLFQNWEKWGITIRRLLKFITRSKRKRS